MLSLTREQLLRRLVESQRSSLLALAINEDAKRYFTFKVEANSSQEVNIDVTEPLRAVTKKLLLRAIDIAYDENLD